MSTVGKEARTGGCQCGAVRYVIRAEPREVYVCHCTECRRQSASAFGISVIVDSAALVLTDGAPKVWTRAATLQGSMACFFCPDCGTRLWHGDPAKDDCVSVKGGSLDSPPDLRGARHIWVKSKLPGVAIPADAETFPEEPPA
ncbi:MAG: GFA family protein [Kiloniellaceae bacterium]